MGDPLPSLSSARWLSDPAVRKVFDILAMRGEETRIVGGAVRDALMGREVREIDFATTADPETVARLAEGAGIRAVPTGIEHGTVTLVVDHRSFEVTTLREDVETDGRRAVVRFGRDWESDALRRDFTINALSVEADGTLHDPVGGMPDIAARRVRFIGEADRRIAEDRLRALRFFRFHAQFGAGEPDREGLDAAIRARLGLSLLSAERLGQEMRKLAVAPGAAAAASAMQDGGILPVILAGVGYPATLSRLMAIEAVAGHAPHPAVRLAALGCRIEEDALRLAERFRLSNADGGRMAAAVGAARLLARSAGARSDRAALYRRGAEAFADGALMAFAWHGPDAPDSAAVERIGLPERWQAPAFPMSGRDIIGHGVTHGPDIGRLLGMLEEWWISEDFAPDRAALVQRLSKVAGS